MMLQKIDGLSWDVGDDYTVDYAPSTLHVEDLNHWRFYEIDLPPGVVLAQEVDAPADPFMPDWNAAPKWAEWHTVGPHGNASWWDTCPTCDGEWWCHATGIDTNEFGRVGSVDLSGLDWRNSLRHRPDGA